MKQRIAFLAGVAAYIGLLHWSYIEISYPWFGYLGSKYTAPPPWLLFLSLVVAFVPALWIPIRTERPSQAFELLIYITAYVPICSLPMYILPRRYDDVIQFAITLIPVMGLFRLLATRKVHPLDRGVAVGIPFEAALLFIAFALNAIMVGSYGISFRFVSLSEVYDVRLALREVAADASPLAAYALEWLNNVINPAMIAWGLTRRRPILIAAGGVGQLLIYSLSGVKVAIFTPLLIVFLLRALRNRGRTFGLAGSWGMTAMFAVAIGSYRALGNPWFHGLFTHRLTAITGVLTAYYLDFFSVHGFVYMSYSRFNIFSPPLYPLPPPRMIGLEYFGSPDVNANANIWADAYANFGYVGVFVATGLLVLYLHLLDRLAADRDPVICAVLLVMAAQVLANAGLQTSMLGHGVWLVALVIFLMPPTEESLQKPVAVPGQRLANLL